MQLQHWYYLVGLWRTCAFDSWCKWRAGLCMHTQAWAPCWSRNLNIPKQLNCSRKKKFAAQDESGTIHAYANYISVILLPSLLAKANTHVVTHGIHHL
jgi:hypothetical protein